MLFSSPSPSLPAQALRSSKFSDEGEVDTIKVDTAPKRGCALLAPGWEPTFGALMLLHVAGLMEWDPSWEVAPWRQAATALAAAHPLTVSVLKTIVPPHLEGVGGDVADVLDMYEDQVQLGPAEACKAMIPLTPAAVTFLMLAYGKKTLSIISSSARADTQLDSDSETSTEPADQRRTDDRATDVHIEKNIDLGLHSLIRAAAGTLPPDEIMQIVGSGVAHRCWMHVAEILGQASARRARTVLGLLEERGLKESPVHAWLQDKIETDGRGAQVSFSAFATFASGLEDAAERDVTYALLLNVFGTKDVPVLCEAVPSLAWVSQSLRGTTVHSTGSTTHGASQSRRSNEKASRSPAQAEASPAERKVKRTPDVVRNDPPPPWRRPAQATCSATLFLANVTDTNSFFKLGRRLGFYVNELKQNAKFNGPRGNPFGGSLRMPRGRGGFQYFEKENKVIVQGHEDEVKHWVSVLTGEGAEYGPVRGRGAPNRPPPRSAFDE